MEAEEWGSADYSELIARLPDLDLEDGGQALEERLARELFRKYDRNDSGTIDSGELRSLLADMFEAAKVNPDRRAHVLDSYIKYLATHGFDAVGSRRDISWDDFSLLFRREDFAFVLPTQPTNGPPPAAAVGPTAAAVPAPSTAADVSPVPPPRPVIDYRALPSRIPRLRRNLKRAKPPEAPVDETDLAAVREPVVKLVPSGPLPGSRLRTPTKVKRQRSLWAPDDAGTDVNVASGASSSSASTENVVPLVGLAMADLAAELTVDCGTSAEILFSPDGRYAAVTAHDNFVDVFECAARRKLGRITHPFALVSTVAWSDDASVLTINAGLSSARRFEVPSCKRVLDPDTQESTASALAKLTFGLQDKFDPSVRLDPLTSFDSTMSFRPFPAADDRPPDGPDARPAFETGVLVRSPRPTSPRPASAGEQLPRVLRESLSSPASSLSLSPPPPVAASAGGLARSASASASAEPAGPPPRSPRGAHHHLAPLPSAASVARLPDVPDQARTEPRASADQPVPPLSPRLALPPIDESARPKSPRSAQAPPATRSTSQSRSLAAISDAVIPGATVDGIGPKSPRAAPVAHDSAATGRGAVNAELS